MSPDFEGLRILESYLASVNPDEFFKKNRCSNDILEINKSISNSSGNKMSCKTCGISVFYSLEEFKTHRQSEEHLSNLTKSIDLSSRSSASKNSDFPKESLTGTPFFEIINNGTKLQCYKALLADRKEEKYSKASLELNLDLYNDLKKITESYFLLALNGGGYFAAAIFDNSAKLIVCSKTIRRYTTRRKQGGSQSLKDNEKSGKIHSAGSLIRRENEKKLRDDILNLISDWEPHMKKCSLIFCNRDLFLTQEVFKDLETRNFPFTTYQADFEEICRCYTELFSSIKIS